MGKFTIKLYAIFYAIITNRNNVIKLRILYKHENVVFSQLLDCENQKSLNSTQVMTYNHDRHEILRKVGLSFSHCHLHSVCRSTPGTGHTSLCNICDKSPRFYCSCSLFAQHSCDVFEKRYIQDLHCDVRPGDDVRFPGWWDQALVCVWSSIGWFSYLSPCWKVSRHSHRQDQECCTKLPWPTSHWRLG